MDRLVHVLVLMDLWVIQDYDHAAHAWVIGAIVGISSCLQECVGVTAPGCHVTRSKEPGGGQYVMNQDVIICPSYSVVHPDHDRDDLWGVPVHMDNPRHPV